MKKITCFILLVAFLSTVLSGEDLTKRTLQNSMNETYIKLPTSVNSLDEMFQEGIFYGRFRFNTFAYHWEQERRSSRKDHYTFGLGGSLLYKSGYFRGVGITTGLYTTQNPIHMDDEDANYYKAGKGVLSRYDILEKGRYGITSLAQAYLEYKIAGTSLKVGRQIVETSFTKSNDTKMIPNTFEGITFFSSSLPKTTLKTAYLTRQKLRDHSEFHHLLAYSDRLNSDYTKWQENDDAGMHRGLTLSKLKAKGIDDKLYIAQIENRSIDSFTWIANYTAVPDLFSLTLLEGRYVWQLANGFKIKPALRYIMQYDDGAGAIGGANLKTNITGYKASDSVNSNMWAARMDFAYEALKVRLAYSKVADEADLIVPWRGFPTVGFTRAMAQYNWYANTKTTMLRVDYNFEQAQLYTFVRYAIQDFDDEKSGVQSDSNVLTLDLIKRSTLYPNLYAKVRMAYVKGKDDVVSLDGITKADPSYRELRFEVNYLF
ncbi:MAG: OprD family outer membrane porin [Epsilonproteobacteria bacterium]|nr:OprD family outer membrane porin [Campylobacterota bacterium]